MFGPGRRGLRFLHPWPFGGTFQDRRIDAPIPKRGRPPAAARNKTHAFALPVCRLLNTPTIQRLCRSSIAFSTSNR
ncbi:hypothetical protein VTJ04DRAFT_4390 [Mycothermus thermophilus]|uniref:uncharacterized protein n=1 Tax=Humicola insolens TaxID=85995 RepID=UPI0037435DCD